MSEPQVSELGCKRYNNGFRCEAGLTTGCPYVHDNLLRKESFEKRYGKNWQRKKEEGVAASRAALQKQYNNILAAKSPNIPNVNKAKQIISAKRVLTTESNSEIQSIIQQAAIDLMKFNFRNPDPNIINSVCRKINDIKIDAMPDNKFETVYQLGWATVVYSKPNAQLASKFPKPNNRVCKFFMDTGSCKKGDRCDWSHFVVSPTNPQAPWPGVKHETCEPEMEDGPDGVPRRKCPAPKYSWDVYNINAPVEIQQAKESYAATVSKGLFASQTAAPKSQHSKAASQGPAITTSQGSVNSSENSWDTTRRTSSTSTQAAADAARWALEVQRQAPFAIPAILYGDKAPMSATFHGFQGLPAELRIKIWKLAFKEYHQTARVAWKWDDYYMGNYYRSRLESQNPLPTFMMISKDVKEIACRYHFENVFGTTQAAPDTWFNFKNDRLFIQTSSPKKLIETALLIIPRERKLVTYLQLPLKDFIFNPNDFAEVVTSFTSLKGLYLIASDDHEDSNWTQNPRLQKKVKHTIEKKWVLRQKKHRPENMLPVPDVWIELVRLWEAKAYGVDGILWHAGAGR